MKSRLEIMQDIRSSALCVSKPVQGDHREKLRMSQTIALTAGDSSSVVISASVAQLGGSLESLVVTDHPPSIKENGLISGVAERPVRCAPLKEGWEIPVIDISQLRGPGREQTVLQIGRACQEWGFFYVVNHGVPETVIEDMWEAYRLLFALPLHERAKFQSSGPIPANIQEKLSQNKEKMQKLSLWKDSIRFADLNPDDEGALPHAPQSFRKPAFEYYRAVRNVGFELLKAVSESLGMEADHILNATGNNRTMTSSLHHYPRCPDPATVGFLPHRDYTCLTVVLQDETAGLQVSKEHRWVDVKALPGSFVVNVGEAMEIITNGKFKSILHRVLTNTEKARSSIVCALIPTPDGMVGPLSPLVNEENPALYSNDTFANFFYNHFAKLLK